MIRLLTPKTIAGYRYGEGTILDLEDQKDEEYLVFLKDAEWYTGDQDLSGLVAKSSNLSDLANIATARGNLGLGILATEDTAMSGVPYIGEMFADDNGATIWKLRDRVFVGDSADYTGNRIGTNGYGTSWITESAASWILKNAVFSASSAAVGGGRIGILGASRTSPGETSIVNCGIAALSLNEGEGSHGRAFYAEVMHRGNALASEGMEIQCGNYSSQFPTANAYDMSLRGVAALYLGAESGTGYTTGDADTPITPPTQPCGPAIDLSGGSLNASYQKFVTGLVFRNGALYRDENENAIAMSLARRHTIKWMSSTAIPGAIIRSDVVSIANQDVGLLFKNNAVHITGAGEVPLGTFSKDAGGTPVNYLDVKNARTNIAPAIAAVGSDTDIDIALTPKGSGTLRFGSFSALAAEVITGYITVKDSSGVSRKLAVVA